MKEKIMGRDAEVMTVLGPIASTGLGTTLPHEHLFIDLRFVKTKTEWTSEKVSIRNLHRLRVDYTCMSDNLLLASVGTAANEVARFRDFGGGSLVDAGSIGTGRKPYALKQVSQTTGVNIVMGTGFYIKQSLDTALLNYSEQALLKMLLKECRYGYRGSGIRPGIIGEIGVGPTFDEWDKKSLKIAGMLQKETGLSITIHIQAVPVIEGFARPNGVEVVDFMETLGTDLSRTVIGHADAQMDMDYLRSLLSRGVYVEFDHFGKEFYLPELNFCMARDIERVQAIGTLVGEGYGDRILISTDICLKQDLTTYGGHGYAHILETVVPMMKHQGLEPKTIQRIMVDNPKRVLETKSNYF
jgi:phosphotriesterase-related protein